MASSATRKAQALARVLLVDDNCAGLAARRMVLEDLGYQTVCTTCPKEALSFLQDEAFDLVVTDYRMPEMNGDAFITALRETHPKVPVIMISGFVDALGLSEKTTGADAVIMKSNHEVSHLVRAAKRLTSQLARRKPPHSAPSSTPKSRAKGLSSS